MPAMMPSKAKPVVTVEVSLMLRNGKSPVRINHRPSKSIPRFLPAKLLVSAISFSFSSTDYTDYADYQRGTKKSCSGK